MDRGAAAIERVPCDCRYIKSASRTVLLVLALGLTALLNGCSTTPIVTPHRIPDLTYPETGQSSYFWTTGGPGSGFVFFMQDDYATITEIDGVDIPADYASTDAYTESVTRLLEIPAGQHVVEILYTEEKWWLCGYGGCASLEQTRQTLAFNAEPNRTYVPFVSDDCSRKWFWIEDWGPYVEGSETRRQTVELYQDRYPPGKRRISMTFEDRSGIDVKEAVVAGEAPSEDTCESGPTKFVPSEYAPTNRNSADFPSDRESGAAARGLWGEINFRVNTPTLGIPVGPLGIGSRHLTISVG